MALAEGYAKSVHIGGASPRETEILAFGLCNARLAKAADPRARIEALSKTHQLWSLLVRDLAMAGNNLPEKLRHELIDIGFWAMRYSTGAMTTEWSVTPLIEVNRNIMEGLRSQQSAREPAKLSSTAQRAADSA